MALILWVVVRLLWAVVGMAGVFAVLPAVGPGFLDALVAEAPLVLFLAFCFGAPWVLVDQWLHQQQRNARAQRTYAALRRGRTRLNKPLVCYLRSFDWDEKFGNEKVERKLFGPWILWFFINPLILLFFVWVRLYERLGGRLESLLYRAASRSWGPMTDVSLGRSTGAKGFGRVRTTDAAWKETASTLLDNADLVLMMFSDTTGTSWELEQLVARGRVARAVFLTPPAYALRTDKDMRKYQLERDYRIFSERMRSLGYATPAYGQALAFRVDPNPDRVTSVFFDEDFDKGRSKTLRKWLRAQIAEINADGALKTEATSARWRGWAAGLAQFAVAAVIGQQLGTGFAQQSAAISRSNELLQSQCASAEGAIDDGVIVAACSAIIESAGGALYADINVLNDRGLAYMRRGALPAATADFTSVIARNGSDPIAFYNRARARQEQNDMDGAFADFSRVIELGADTIFLADSYAIRGDIFAGRGDTAAAMRDFDAAIELDPQYAPALVLRAALNYRLQDNAAAIADCDRVLTLEPENKEAFVFRALAHSASGDDAAAVSDLDRVIALAPDDANTLRLRGQARIRLGQRVEGDADLATADAIESSAAANSTPP